MAQTPYERWFQGIIYGSNGRVYADSSAIITGQFYPSYTFLVKTDEVGLPVQTRDPSITGRSTSLNGSVFTPTGELLLQNNNSGPFPTWPRPAFLSKWNTALDTVWAYAFRDTAYDTSLPYNAPTLLASDDGYAAGFTFVDSLPPQASVGAIVFVDTAGSALWTKEFPTTLSITHLVRANDGGFLCTGTVNGTDHVYFRTDDQFNPLWCHKLIAPFELRSEQIVQGNDDAIHYFVGIRDTAEVINFGYVTYSRSMAWLNIDPATGAILSTREIDFQWPTLLALLQRTSDGQFLAAGRYTNTSLLFGVLRRWEAFVLKLNADGDMIWADSLAMPGYRNRVISMDEHNDRLLLYTERYDDINPFHQYFVGDTSATPICGLERTDFLPLGSLPITDATYALPVFTSVVPERTSVTWTIGTTAMASLHLCGSISTDVAQEAPGSLLLFPNPATNELNLGSVGDPHDGLLRISDPTGRVVLIRADSGSVDISGLAAGTYLITRAAGNGSMHGRFVKE